MKTNNYFMKTFCLLVISAFFCFCVTETFSQKQMESIRATEAVKSFYRFHTAHDDLFNQKQIAFRKKFFTPKLQRLFNAELIRQRNYLKKYPDNKPYFQGLPFQPIEFCPNDYKVEKSAIKNSNATVKVNFVYGKTDCNSSDGTKIFYKIKLVKMSGRWLIDNVIFDDGKDLISAFNEAQKIK